MFNDNGVSKPQQGLAQVDRSEIANVTLSLRNQGMSQATEWLTDRKLPLHDGTRVQLTIPAGGIAIVELK